MKNIDGSVGTWLPLAILAAIGLPILFAWRWVDPLSLFAAFWGICG